MNSLRQPLADLFELLSNRIETDPELHQALVRVARALLEGAPSEVVGPPAEQPAPPALAEPPGPVAPPGIDLPAAAEPAREPLPPVTFAPTPIPQRPESAAAWPADRVDDTELPMIAQRCTLRAEAARWAARRRRLIQDGVSFETEIEPVDRDIIARARQLPNCFLWTNHPHGTVPEDLRLYELLAECYDTLADAASLVNEIVGAGVDSDDEFVEAVYLLAESQNAVRAAVDDIGHPMPDSDQFAAFRWLRRTSLERGVYVPQFMKASDRAEPADWQDRRERIEAIRAARARRRDAGRQRKTLLSKIRYHLQRIEANKTDQPDHDWQVVIDAVDRLAASGLPPSNPELRDLLVPFADVLPDRDVSEAVARVYRELDHYIATRRAGQPVESAAEVDPDVQRVADLLAGRWLVLIGGVRRPHAEAALKKAFRLDGLNWIETREHQSIEGFAAHIARPEVAVVVLAIRWSSHSFGGVLEFCQAYGKPLVRLPAGYGARQVARQILEQVSGRLAPGG